MGRLIVAFVADLMFQTRIESVAEKLGLQIQWLVSADQIISTGVEESPSLEPDEILVERLTNFEPQLFIFDLGNRAIPWASWIPVLKSHPATRSIPVICFGSHVNVSTLKEARRAGADEVLARSRFVTALPELIEKFTDET